MNDRPQQILRQACGILVNQGYAALTMRAVARASGLKLGALQYHYRTRDELLRALAEFIGQHYRDSFEDYWKQDHASASRMHAFVEFWLVDPLADVVSSDRLFPQLWAMGLVEPRMRALLDETYEEGLTFLEQGLRERGLESPRADALAIMSMLEGMILFVGRGQRWEQHAPGVVEAMHAMIEARYGVARSTEGEKK